MIAGMPIAGPQRAYRPTVSFGQGKGSPSHREARLPPQCDLGVRGPEQPVPTVFRIVFRVHHVSFTRYGPAPELAALQYRICS